MIQLRLVPTIIVKYLLRIFYNGFCLLFKVHENKVTFASYRSNRLKDNLYYVYHEIGNKYPSYKRHILFRTLDSKFFGKIIYVFHMIHACYHLATSRIFIVDDYYFPLYVLRLRKNVEVIQLWHSSGALKKFGLSTVGKPYGPSESYLKHVNVHGNYSKVFVSTKNVIPYYSEAFGMSRDRIYPLGVPRTDYFFKKNQIKRMRTLFYKNYPKSLGKKIVLYAPTFRGKSHQQGSFECPFNLEYMQQHMKSDFVLLIHLHPYMQKDFFIPDHLSDFVINIESNFTIMELLALTDVLITDYSSVFIDFSLLERPMIFFANDLEEYTKERDFYYDYDKLIPGPKVNDTKTLVNIIMKNEFDKQQIKYFSDYFFDHKDGKATERIVQHIMKDMEQ